MSMGEGRDTSMSLFQSAYLASLSLEEYKPRLRRGDEQSRSRASAICARCEETIDAAWGLVALIAKDVGGTAAEVVAEHYLFGDDWHTVSAMHGLPYDLCKKLAYSAIRSLDEGGRYEGV